MQGSKRVEKFLCIKPWQNRLIYLLLPLLMIWVSTRLLRQAKIRLNMEKVDRVLGVALGSGVETNPLQMAQAYAAFANEGLMPEAHFISRIENASGQVIANHKIHKNG